MTVLAAAAAPASGRVARETPAHELPLPTVNRFTLEEARFERWDYDHHGNHTPWYARWERAAYERVVFPLWAELRAGFQAGTADDPGTRPRGADALARLPGIVRSAALRHPVPILEQFLDAAGVPFEDETGEIAPGCPCTVCRAARQRGDDPRRALRDVRVRVAFMDELMWHVEIVLRTPNAYDRRHGAPVLDWRRRRGEGGNR